MLKDHKVIVMGVSGLLGERLAGTFLSRGASVIGVDKRDSLIKEEKYRFVKHDFVNDESAEEICDTVRECFGGKLDILINVLPEREESDLQSVSGKDFAEYLTESLFAAIEMNRKLYPMLRKSEHGNSTVINIGSAASRRITMSSGLECLCAQTMVGLTRMQAGFFEGVRYNSISPARPKDQDTCQDIINTVLFLCSKDASFITGSDFLLDYGESAKNAARLETK